MSPFFLQWKALEALTNLFSLQKENENDGERTPSTFTQWRGEWLNEMVLMCYCQGVSP